MKKGHRREELTYVLDRKGRKEKNEWLGPQCEVQHWDVGTAKACSRKQSVKKSSLAEQGNVPGVFIKTVKR